MSEEVEQEGIGGIGNYYGGLEVRKEQDSYYWCIPNYDGEDWDEIPKSLYDELIKHNQS